MGHIRDSMFAAAAAAAAVPRSPPRPLLSGE